MSGSGGQSEPERDARTPGGGGRRCPVCNAEVSPTAATLPFCSSRCRMVDLGRWMQGEYVISRELREADLEQGE